MPRQEILSPAQHAQLLTLPTDLRQIADRYTFTQADLDLIAECRGDQNRMGFAIQLCFLRYPGRAWTPEESIPVRMLGYVADQLRVTPDHLSGYALRDQTRREHLAKLVAVFRWKRFGVSRHPGFPDTHDRRRLHFPRVSRHPTSWLAISVSRWVSGFPGSPSR